MTNETLNDIKSLRAEVDALDDRLIELLIRRFSAVRKIGARKAAAGAPVLQPDREFAVYERVRNATPNELQRYILPIYSAILAESRAMQEEP